MIPDGGSTKVDVEVCVAALHAHQTVPIAEEEGQQQTFKRIIL